MPEPKKHHYLPQFYLKKFCRDGLLWVYDREQNEYRQQAPKVTAVRKHYYTTLKPDGAKSTEIEKFFSVIESRTKPIINKIDRRQKITQEEKETIAIFISFLHTRIPDFEKMVNELTTKSMDAVNKKIFSSEKSAAAIMRKVESKTGEKFEISPQDMVNFVRSGEYTLEQSNRGYTLDMMLDMGKNTINFLLNMDWAFAQTSGDNSFITSDNPFTLIPPKDYDPKGFYGYGLTTPGAKKIIPLSKMSCLSIGDYGHSVMGGIIPKEVVRKINISLAIGCDRFIIARDKEILERIVKLTRINQWKKTSRVKVG